MLTVGLLIYTGQAFGVEDPEEEDKSPEQQSALDAFISGLEELPAFTKGPDDISNRLYNDSRSVDARVESQRLKARQESWFEIKSRLHTYIRATPQLPHQ